LCYAGSRLIVHASLHDRLLALVMRQFSALEPKRTWEDGAGLAPILNERQLTRIEGILADSVAAGADIRMGGTRIERDGGGLWFQPTVLSCASGGLRACREEIFGPVLTVQVFDDEEEG